MNTRESQLSAFNRLLEIMDDLREKCPWDKKQTFETLRHLTIEETYELTDAIFDRDLEEIKKELGDVLLHIVFYAKLGSEENAFDIADVCNAISDKLVMRHPHIYADVHVDNEEDVKKNWEKLKLKEGNTSVLSGVPKSLPAMIKAMRIQEKAKGVGFDWDNADQVWDKVEEEMNEFQAEVQKDDVQKMEEEFGDVLFSMINYARFKNINPEDALEKTNKKFIYRFQYLEQEVQKDGKQLSDLTLEEMDVYWNRAKIEKQKK
ncbi:nucleoside triphosphate pyrophosphohydrolase [Myroides ceti]|uniref:Nucleoside triphosphate pyrophosphohydrolase n=1 Tax=Paenimyroides ceti TaxID=395087 RepID=A0ABT8CTW5_9FLAO|nr:nucleoside triphosphate pyrophosphohydrolase [Paenimyroides ceti]MDN3707624.1 nucleoside triphosphate pyrophosphohydrolase [Paenimyroides ceti]MDN3709728.1 nucleoside triphosphate pyrophosphohydrolase [Paenimyroides ceti]